MTDILTLIDNATESRCACGCGTPLDPDGPSAWFADQTCQRRWNEARATDPQDVYNRPDGGDGYSYESMTVVNSNPGYGGRFFLGDEEITDHVVPGSLTFMEAFARTVLVPEATEGRSGLVSTTWDQAATTAPLTPEDLSRVLERYYAPLRRMEPTVSPMPWLDNTRDYWSPPARPPGMEGFSVHLSTVDETAGWTIVGSDDTYHYIAPSITFSSGQGVWTPAPGPIEVTGYYLDTSSLGAFLDEAIWEATGRAAALSVARTVLERVRRRLRLRVLHSAYSARLRARRRRNRR